MTGPKGICKRCGEIVGSQQTAVYAIRGYEQDRVAGGANKIMRRERIDGWIWHAPCWDELMRERHGVQGSLL